jgi:hypothetical protein
MPKPPPNRTVAEAVGYYHPGTTSARPGCDCEFCEIFRLREALDQIAAIKTDSRDSEEVRMMHEIAVNALRPGCLSR